MRKSGSSVKNQPMKVCISATKQSTSQLEETPNDKAKKSSRSYPNVIRLNVSGVTVVTRAATLILMNHDNRIIITKDGKKRSLKPCGT